ncbi:MAG: NAD(P)-dependent oxidoreductase [Dinoroseobacter sp.]|nr:NAD(P)-dependent oxidoreductase [Dinoroseobacter sp.]
MKIALTGSTGLFGRHCQALLEAEGIEYVPLTRQEWDLRDWVEPERLSSLLQGADVIVHAAACLPGEADLRRLFDVNLRAVINLAEWAQDNGVYLVFISSGSVYADPHAQRIDENAVVGPGPIGGIYAASKRLAEAALEEFAATGLKHVVLRPSSVYGAGMAADQLLARLLAQAKAGRPVRITGGQNRIDFLHVHDLCRAALAAVRSGAMGVFNIASGTPASLEEVARIIAQLCGVRTDIAPVEHDPAPFLRFSLDSSAARAAFGYTPLVDLPSGLAMSKSGALIFP